MLRDRNIAETAETPVQNSCTKYPQAFFPQALCALAGDKQCPAHGQKTRALRVQRDSGCTTTFEKKSA